MAFYHSRMQWSIISHKSLGDSALSTAVLIDDNTLIRILIRSEICNRFFLETEDKLRQFSFVINKMICLSVQK